MSESTNLGLPYLAASQAQKHVTVNESLRLLDGLVQLSVLSRAVSTPPGSPADGARWIVGAGASGAWAGWENDIAYRVDGAWIRIFRRPGMRAWVEDENALVIWDGDAWAELSGGPFYETGTFTPTFTFTTPGDLSNTYQKQTGFYTRIGDRVLFEVLVRWTPTFSTSSGQGLIEGLPFTVPASIYGDEGGNGIFFPLASHNFPLPSGAFALWGRINPDASALTFVVTRDGSTISSVGAAEIPSGVALRAHFAGSFQIAP